MMFSYAIDRLKDMRGGAVVVVTHDMILTPPLGRLFGYDYLGKGLVPFLDGMILYQSDGGYVATHGGKSIRVSSDGRFVPPA